MREECSSRKVIAGLLGGTPLAPPDLKDIEKELGVSRARLAEVIRVMEREGSIVRVTPDLVFLTVCIDRVKNDLFHHLSQSGDITPGAFRDLFGTTRKYAIPLLEYLDREGVSNQGRRRAATEAGIGEGKGM